MDNVKNDEYFIQKIRTDLSFVVERTRKIKKLVLLTGVKFAKMKMCKIE